MAKRFSWGRQLRGFTQVTLAERTGVPLWRLQLLERGYRAVEPTQFQALWHYLTSSSEAPQPPKDACVMARPHPHLDRERSPLEALRIKLGLTLEAGSRLTGGKLSRAALHRMERSGRGSAQAWSLVASALGVTVEAIRPASVGLAPQLPLWSASSS